MRSLARRWARRARQFLLSPAMQTMPHRNLYALEQLNLMNSYRQLQAMKHPPLRLRDVGFRVHSQHEEDGILLFVYSLIGMGTKRCVEIGSGDGIECNCANLIVNHRWIGLLCDTSEANVARAREYYAGNPDTRYWPPVVVRAHATRDNINEIVGGNGFTGEIDLLSIDVDGIDYWLWKALDCVSPRVVVVEINHLWGPQRAVSVPYRDDFRAEFTKYGSDYAGASIAAFVKLGQEKGYRLAGTNAFATNAFFIRDDIECEWLPEVDPAECFWHPRAQFGMRERWPAVAGKEWVDV